MVFMKIKKENRWANHAAKINTLRVGMLLHYLNIFHLRQFIKDA